MCFNYHFLQEIHLQTGSWLMLHQHTRRTIAIDHLTTAQLFTHTSNAQVIYVQDFLTRCIVCLYNEHIYMPKQGLNHADVLYYVSLMHSFVHPATCMHICI